MADVELVVSVLFLGAVAVMTLGLAAFLLTARAASPPARVLGVMLLLAAAFPALSAGTRLAEDPALDLALGRTAEDLLLFGQLAILVVLTRYPRPARGREWAILAPAFLLVGAQVVAWFGARAWLVPPGDPTFRATLQWQLLSPYSTLGGLLADAALLLAYRRARALPEAERRGARIVLSTMMLATFFAPGVLMVLLPGALGLSAPLRPLVFGEVAGDCCGIAPTLWTLAYVVAPVGIALHVALRDRHRLPLAYVGAGLIVALLGVAAGIDLTPAGAILTTSGLLYAIGRHGALGIRDPPPQLALALALLVGIGAFFVVHSAAIGAGPGNPLLLTVGLVGGVGVGAAATTFSLPRARGLLDLLRAPDATTTRDRLEPYRVVLEQELAAGASHAALREKLRPLRASLGVSDQEHAVLEYVVQSRRAPPLAAAQVSPGRRFLDRYRVLRTLREGGAGVTHLCHDERLGRDVVLKTLRAASDPDALDALLREARALARVAHPRVVTLLDADRVGDEAFLVMEHVTGGSLADRLQRGALGREATLALADDLLGALGAVHASGLTHRDVKPSNVLLDAAGRAKLADFGIAHIPGFETTAAVAADARVVGTIRYMSPEQARGRPLGPRSDLYSAALVLYEAWTGAPYLDARPAESAIELQLRAASAAGFDRPWDGPEPMRAFWARALHPLPSERFATAEEMLRALRRAAGGV